MRIPILLLAFAPVLLADGGMVLLHREAAPFVVTVFASPTPPRAGMIDLSVLLQTSETLDPVLDAEVQLVLENGGSNIRAIATHDQTQNKMLFAASVHLDHPGDWRYSVIVKNAITVDGIIAVSPEQPRLAAYAGYLALPFVCLAIFALHQWLSLSRRHLESERR
jgi:hypothetical protein